MKKVPWNDITARISGLSCPIFGVSWTPEPNERKIAEEAVTYIENQGIFYAGFEWEHPKDCYVSAEKVRVGLTDIMQRLNRNMEVFRSLEIIRDSLRTFQRTLRTDRIQGIESKTEITNEQCAKFDDALTKLRFTSGEHIARLCVAYGLDAYEELTNWFPTSAGN